MYRPGYTVTPDVSEDAYGNIVGVDFDLERPQGFDSRYSPQDYYEDHEGQTHHLFEDTELDESEDDEWTSDNYLEQTAYLLHELVGGSGAYQQMMAWAAANLDQQAITDYDQLIDYAAETGDFGEVEEAAQAVYQMFLEAGDQMVYGFEEDGDEYEGDDDSDTGELQQAIYQYVGGEASYLAMLHWGFENLTASQTDWFDDCIESGDPELINEAVTDLFELYLANA